MKQNPDPNFISTPDLCSTYFPLIVSHWNLKYHNCPFEGEPSKTEPAALISLNFYHRLHPGVRQCRKLSRNAFSLEFFATNRRILGLKIEIWNNCIFNFKTFPYYLGRHCGPNSHWRSNWDHFPCWENVLMDAGCQHLKTISNSPALKYMLNNKTSRVGWHYTFLWLVLTINVEWLTGVENNTYWA